jgi:hypothetical protein
MENIIYGLFFLLGGCLMLYFLKPLARLTIETQNKFWGFHFGNREIKNTSFIILVVGIGFLVAGLLSLFQIIQFK